MSVSAAEKFGNDGRRDSRKDRMSDEISPLVLMAQEDEEDRDRDEDDLDAADAAAHRKKTAVWALKQRRASRKGSSSQEEEEVQRPILPVELERRLLRAPGTPGVVWTMGEDSLGQCGHARKHTNGLPYPAVVDPIHLKGGVRAVHAGSYCTLVVNAVGEVYAFGSGPFRAAAPEPPKPPESRLAYSGAPPFRVNSAVPPETNKPKSAWDMPRQPKPSAGAPAGNGTTLLGFADVLGTDQGDKLEANRYASTAQMVHTSIQRRRDELGLPTLLSQLLMPVEQIECGDDFCVTLMQNGIVFAWGDGEEGKLGLGRPTSQEKPTMVDFLLPSSYLETAKRSANKDALLKTGAKVITRKRDADFLVVSISCGARHTVALSANFEAFTWGAGGSGQLGHGSYADELLPHPIQAFKKSGTRVLSVLAGAYHSAAVISSTRDEVATHLFTWGHGHHGRLGHGDTAGRATPTEVVHHRTKPVRKLKPGMDAPPSRATRHTDWLSLEGGHVLEWSSLACGGRHTAAISKTGHVFTWGSDEDGQLGHGRLTQRLPTLLWLHRREGKLETPVEDVRRLGCGHRYTAALTWLGEVFVWGQLGEAQWPAPTLVEALRSAVVVSMACGQSHLALVTGELEHIEAERAAYEQELVEAAQVQLDLTKQRHVEMEREMVEAQEEAVAAKNAVKDEKKRVKVLKRLDKKRLALAKKQGRHKKHLDDEEKKEEEED